MNSIPHSQFRLAPKTVKLVDSLAANIVFDPTLGKGQL
jgi:hypothetical protein